MRDGVEGTAHFFCLAAEESGAEVRFIVTGRVGAVSGTDNGVADDVPFKGDELVVDDVGLGGINQPGVIDVAFDFAGGEINVGFNEVTETERGVFFGATAAVKGVRQVSFSCCGERRR